jgi:hypothetical protein
MGSGASAERGAEDQSNVGRVISLSLSAALKRRRTDGTACVVGRLHQWAGFQGPVTAEQANCKRQPRLSPWQQISSAGVRSRGHKVEVLFTVSC